MYTVASQLLEPFTFLYLIAVVSFVVLWFTQRWSVRQGLPLAIGLFGLGVTSTPAVATLAVESLSRQYLPLTVESVDADAIILLTGGGDSCTQYAARMYHARSPRPVIVSGRDAQGQLENFLVSLGVRADDLIVDDRPRNTYENARDSARILRTRELTRPALVTRLTHLPRSVLTFRAQGIDVIPAGCGSQESRREDEDAWRQFIPSVHGALPFEAAAHEWVGMAWYWLNGPDPLPWTP